MNWIIIQGALAFLVFGIASSTNPSIQLPEYLAVGSINTTAKQNRAAIFLGLPYALPPNEERRFEKTEPLPHNYRETVNALTWPKGCHQVRPIPNIATDEDCLYLNIMKPEFLQDTRDLFPVFVFIHGGGYEYGLTEEYGWEYFVDNFVTEKVILITLQYRVAHFGFFATEDRSINGNFGHFDQVEALKFINRNIRAFGGDPNRITVGGHSAGAGSLHSISLSHYSKGLFHQEVRLAGSNYAGYAMNNRDVFTHSALIANAMGCSQDDSTERKACLKSKSPDDFIKARETAKVTDFPLDNLDIVYWTTVFDDDFFAGKNLTILGKEAPKRPTFYGFDAGEGLLWSLYGPNGITNVFSFGGRGFTPENRTLCTADFLRDALHQQLFFYSNFTEAQETEILSRVLNFYRIGKEYDSGDPLYHWNKYTDLYSDLVFKVPNSQEIEYKISQGFNHQYLYVFNHTRPIDLPVTGELPGHGTFLLYFAGLEIYTNNNLTHTPDDVLVQKNLQNLFVSFVKNGVPTSGGLSAPEITADRMPYLELGTSVVIDDVDFKPKVDFWDQLQRDFNYNFFKGLPLDQTAHM